ncbi:hypothetical protein TrLO_g15145, partial [Triparma laevis f. longispina]
PPGKIPNENHACVACVAGKSASFGSTSCSNCNKTGEYSSEGAAFCKVSLGGSVPSSNRDGTFECPANEFSEAESDACLPCEDGFHSKKGSSSCSSCLPGERYDFTTEACVQCDLGKFSATGKGTLCFECDASQGFVASSAGSPSCQYCGAGSYASASSNSCKECPASKFSVGGTSFCSSCVLGQFSSDPGSTSCDLCEAGFTPLTNQTG